MIFNKREISVICLCVFIFSTAQTVNAELITDDWLFCAVDWNGEFTYIDPDVGIIPGPSTSSLPEYIQALATAPDGTLYAGSGESQLYEINSFTGDSTWRANIYTRGLTAMAFSSSGDLFYSSVVDGLGVLDIDTGYTERIDYLTGDISDCQGLAFSPNDLLYGVVPHDGDLDTYDFFKIDIENAVTHLIGTYEGHLNQSLVFTPDGRLFGLGVDGEYSIYRSSYFAEMDPTTGAIIGQVFSFPGDYTGLALVPEPATLALMGLGGIFITTSRHRGKKRVG